MATVEIEFEPGEQVELNEIGKKLNGGKSIVGSVDTVKIDENGIQYSVLHNSGGANMFMFKVTDVPGWALKRKSDD
ncbi:hypothetical protein [Bacillus pumilus]|uniref:hypothetical protein n=1 Tax=Bacillus pumilus TaxID=1408 RepID=UPI0015D53B93|nr:hypothetical protein [Bacillus pumilus]QLI77119.1 hypothetical protein HZ310_04550 [Bacillus pumilus]